VQGVQRGYAVSQAELNSLIALYDAYDGGLGAPSDDLKGPLLTEDLKAGIQAAYRFTQRGGKLQAMRSKLFRGVSHCPICGITPPRELDHHLPQASYRPLAIYVRNLVPLCHDCNQSKSAEAAAGPEQRLIHPYFDVLPDLQFLRATVRLEAAALTVDFDINPAAELPGPLRSRLSSQLHRLKLNQRYQQEINMYLTSHTVALSDAFEASAAEGVRSFLNRRARVERIAFYLNHWRPVLLGALADHEGFCGGGFEEVLPVARAIIPSLPLDRFER
jgi:hypothetical protein